MATTLEEFKKRVASIGMDNTCSQAPASVKSKCLQCTTDVSKTEDEKVTCVATIVMQYRSPSD